jgi:Dipeptide/tripeptide permease
MNRVVSKIFKLLKHQIFLGTVIMGSSFLLLPGAKTYAGYVISMLVLTVGESMVFPTIPALLSKMSTSRNRGTFQSFYSIFRFIRPGNRTLCRKFDHHSFVILNIICRNYDLNDHCGCYNVRRERISTRGVIS